SLAGSFNGLDHPYGIAYDPHNKFLYVTNNDANDVTAYDIQGNQQTLAGSFAVFQSPSGIAYDPLNHWLYVAILLPLDTGAGVFVYDEQGNAQTLPGNPFRRTIQPYGVTYDPFWDGLLVSDITHVPFYTPSGVIARPNMLPNLFGAQDAAIIP
ncbi:MAG: hypothetical protein JO199_14335, partial [Candidatus Eremiobacteraeota bacterium]|nr:hypothetical protein [Candidatus Eremiobacteraeota bacterium]